MNSNSPSVVYDSRVSSVSKVFAGLQFCFNLVPSSGQLGIMGGGLSVQLSVCVRQDQIHTGAAQEEALGFINNFIGSLP